MFTGLIDTITNKATWVSDTLEVVDEETGDTIDLTDGALTVDVAVYIFDRRDPCTQLASATLTNGKAALVGPGFYWQFEDTDLSSLCPKTYRLGVKLTINGVITDFIDGTVAVLQGV